VSIDFSEDAAVIGHCYACGTATKRMENCHDLSCREQLVVCDGHAATTACAKHPFVEAA